ncbi:hypothetical protein HK097_001100 [Rhizophlyctis rosea]|uniref:Uncharacterized protein n=1 Tax=Rhizophlyctis rosea TaxID=64517 RepID=A0AAD5SJG2_9FUNG|nr:hypothetical protein HK097_001100 [Rhizophlyctis rosea]
MIGDPYYSVIESPALTMKVEVTVAGELFVFNVPVGPGVTIADASVSLSFVKDDASPFVAEPELFEVDAPRRLETSFSPLPTNSPQLIPTYIPYPGDDTSSSSSDEDVPYHMAGPYTPFFDHIGHASELLFSSGASDTTCGCGRDESEHGLRAGSKHGYEDDFEEDEDEVDMVQKMKREMEEMILGGVEEVSQASVFEASVQRAFSESAIANVGSDAFSATAFSAPKPRPVSFDGFNMDVAQHTAKWVEEISKDTIASQFDAIFNRRKTIALQAGSGFIPTSTAVQTDSFTSGESAKKTEGTQTFTLRRALSLPSLSVAPKPTTKIPQILSTSTQTTPNTTSTSTQSTPLSSTRGTDPITTLLPKTQFTQTRKVTIDSSTYTDERDLAATRRSRSASPCRRSAYLPLAEKPLQPIPELKIEEVESEGEGKVAGDEEFVIVEEDL